MTSTDQVMDTVVEEEEEKEVMPPASTTNDLNNNASSQAANVHHLNHPAPKMVTLFAQPASTTAVSPVRVLNNTPRNPTTTQHARK